MRWPSAPCGWSRCRLRRRCCAGFGVRNEAGAILNHHRKLVPTLEEVTWTSGAGAGLRVCETRLGRIGVLICGENINPLPRFALMAQDGGSEAAETGGVSGGGGGATN